jgi:Uma2 family endonuclease
MPQRKFSEPRRAIAMTQAKSRFQSFEEYLDLDAEGWVSLGLPEGRCEYRDGELAEVPSESELNDFIANLLMFLLASSGVVPIRLIRPHSCEIEVQGKPRTRYPDLVILQEAHLSLAQRRLIIKLDMPAPQLVVEVVSGGKKNRDRDWVDKRSQYAQRGIPEYWLIDPEYQCITVLSLVNGDYLEHGVFRGGNFILSPTFPALQLTAEQILNAGQ